MTRATLLIFAMFLLVLPTTISGEPPAIERMFPPGGQIGTEVEVALTGKPGDGNLQVWSEHEQLSITFTEKKDKATIKISSDAQPGIHWLRFFNEHGTTNLKPFFVGSTRETTDTEPNNKLDAAQKVEPGTVNGVLHTSGEVDLFAIDLETGQTLTAIVQANRELGSPMDGVLEILDPNGTEIVSNDDDHANDPLVTITVPQSGTYFLRLFAFPSAPNSSIRLHGGANYVYRMTVDIDSGGRATAIPEPVQEQLQIPWKKAGVIGTPGESDEFSFDGRKDQNVAISVAARANFSHLDPVAILKTEAGKVIKEFDDISRGDPDVAFSAVLPEAGQYVLLVKDRFDQGGIRHNYVASVQENQPDFTATVAANSFVLPTDKPLEIPVAIARKNGFDERMAVTVEGLPDGVSAKSVYSENKGDTSKSVKLMIERGEIANAFSGVIRIVCTAEKSKQSESATAPKPNSSERFDALWLTVIK